MKQTAKRWLKLFLQLAVAVVGVWLVARTITLSDRVTLVNETTATKADARVVDDAQESRASFTVIPLDSSGHVAGTARTVSTEELWARPDQKTIDVTQADGSHSKMKLLAVHPVKATHHLPDKFLVQDLSGQNSVISLPHVANLDAYERDHIAYPQIEIGLTHMVRKAKLFYMILALAVLPIAMFITTFRWHLLLEAVGIHISMGRTFAINMVGLFFNTFMFGSTGGDLIKAYYAARHTTHRTWAVISVVMDRGIGLLALVILGGAMAAFQWQIPACRQVAVVAAVVLGAAILGFVVFYTPILRRATGFDFLIDRMPARKFVTTVVKGLEMYGHDHPKKTLQSLLISFPVHATSIISVTLAGHALGLTNANLPIMYYWVIVPVIALVGAIPISPQGAGVMEGFAILLTQGQGVTTSQAVGLTLAYRMTQIFWNLVAGLFLLRGDYHTPTEAEQHQLEEDDSEAGVPAAEVASTLRPPTPAQV